MKYLLAVLAVAWFSCAQAQSLVTGGVSMTVTQDFFRQYETYLVEYLTKHLNGLAIPDWSSDFDAGIPKVVLEFHKQKVIYFSVINKKDPERNGEGRIRV
jgi:hypothetical protein